MTAQTPISNFSWYKTVRFIVLSISLVCLPAAITARPATAQTLTVLHNFTNGGDGANPYAGVTMDRAGNLYGTASYGGSSGDGTVFKVTHSGSGWTLNPLYTFRGGSQGDGEVPLARVVFGPDNALYGTTEAGGTLGAGTVFRLAPGPTACKTALCPWTETVLHNFEGGPHDGSAPAYGDLVFDSMGNIYDTTVAGGLSDTGSCNDFSCGVAYEVSPSNGGWTESVIFYFSGGPPVGFWPYNGFVIDREGNLYGAVTWIGSVIELTPVQNGWSLTLLDYLPGGMGGLIFDHAGNLYGTQNAGSSGNGGTVYELTPSGGGWTETTLYTFSYSGQNTTPGPTSTLAMDASGALYGNTYAEGAFGYGNIFKLTPTQNGWSYTSLHDFTGGSDGAYPWGQVILDASGDVYGTTTAGGSTVGSCYQNLGCGVIFEITP